MMASMLGDYMPLLVGIVVAAILAVAMVVLSWLLGPKKVTPFKNATYECGVQPVGSTWGRFPIKFYLVAILFVLFDVEVVFLWSWLTVFRTAPLQYQVFTAIEAMVYIGLWMLGYLYVVKVDALNWDETLTLGQGKAGEEGA